MSTTQKALFDRLGGRPALKAATREFYERVLADELLQPFFADSDPQELMRHQVSFLSAAFGSGEAWKGKDMRAAHEGRGIEQVHFDRVAGHLGAALEAAGVPEELRDEVLGTAASLAPEILGQ